MNSDVAVRRSRTGETGRVLLLSVGAAIAYGIVHDQITARVCIDYFTIGHPRIFPTESPTLLAIGWGIVATWWVGVMLGFPLAFAAVGGRRPMRTARSLVVPVAKLLGCMAACALLAGVAGFFAADRGLVSLVGGLASRVPADKHAPFIADLWTHIASYAVGFVGGIVLVVRTWRSRANRN